MASDDEPLVSVGMPVFNGAAFLETAIESVLAQEIHDLELVISDNGSTDGTEAICRAAMARDRRIRYFREDVNHGAAWNYNRVLQLSRGTFFHWAAADDYFEPLYLSRCVTELQRDPGLVLAFSTTRVVNAEGEEVRPTWRPVPGYAARERPADRFEDVVKHAGMCLEVFGVTRRQTLARTAGIQAFTSSDRPLLAELALLGRFGHVDLPLFVNRVHRGDSVHAHPDAAERARWFDPKSSLRFPKWRLLRAYLGTGWRCAPTPLDRVSTLSVVMAWAFRQRRALAFDIMRAMPAPVFRHAARVRDLNRQTRRIV